MGLTCTTVVTGSWVSHLWKSLSPHYPQRHRRSRTHQHAHAVGRGGRTAGVYSEDVTSRQNCHSQFTHLPTDPIQLHTELHDMSIWSYARTDLQCSRYVPNINIYCANKLFCQCTKQFPGTKLIYFPQKHHVTYIKGQISMTPNTCLFLN